MTAVTGFNDRNMINQCLLYRYIISYEPYNFKGRLDDYPLTMAYGKQMDALRTELREYFWDGEFRARGRRDGDRRRPAAPPLRRLPRPRDGKRGLVIANYSDDAGITVEALLDSGQPLTRYRLVDDPTWRPVAEGIRHPAAKRRRRPVARPSHAPLPGTPPLPGRGYNLTLSPSHRLTTPPPRALAHSQLDAPSLCSTAPPDSFSPCRPPPSTALNARQGGNPRLFFCSKEDCDEMQEEYP